MKKALSLVLMIVLIVALAVPAASAADDTIKIGYIGDLSQSTALWGNAGKFGALEAIEEINAAGGVLDGKMLELVPMDGKGDSADSVNALRKLITDNGIVAEIGTNFSSCNIPMFPSSAPPLPMSSSPSMSRAICIPTPSVCASWMPTSAPSSAPTPPRILA